MPEPQITILGVGGAGCRILRQISASPAAATVRLFAFDSDTNSLEESGLPPENRIIAGLNLRSGRGCGGDEILGQRAAAVERAKLTRILENCGPLIIVGGLGGGMCTGALPVLLGITVKMHITTILMLTLPFAMEGYGRRKLADTRICADLLPIADCLITLPNDLLFSTLPPETPLSSALELADKEMARTALALSAILFSGSIFSADAASFSAMLKRRNAVCSIGVGVAHNGEDTGNAIERMLLSPLLGGPEQLQKSDAVVFTLTGGPELSLGDAKYALDLANAQLDASRERKILIGAGTSPEWAGELQLTALAIRYNDKQPETPPLPDISITPVRRSESRKNHPQDNNGFVQQMLDLDTVDKGIMEKTTPVIFNGEDLDVPTFKRRGIFIEQ